MNTSEKNAAVVCIDRRDSDGVDRRDIDLEQRNASAITLAAYVKQAVDLYFTQLRGYDAVGLHALVINEIEKPLLAATLEHSGYNQTKAAKALGLSRSTLRKKLEHYGLS